MKTNKFDILDHLATEQDIARYVQNALAENDPEFIPVVLGDAARARRKIAEVAKSAGIARTSVYRALSPRGRASFSTIARAARALGYRISLSPIA
jgi:probable addiction module antidote protein